MQRSSVFNDVAVTALSEWNGFRLWLFARFCFPAQIDSQDLTYIPAVRLICAPAHQQSSGVVFSLISCGDGFEIKTPRQRHHAGSEMIKVKTKFQR